MSGELSVQVGIAGAEQLSQAYNLGVVAVEPLCFPFPVAEVTEGNAKFDPDNSPGSNKYGC